MLKNKPLPKRHFPQRLKLADHNSDGHRDRFALGYSKVIPSNKKAIVATSIKIDDELKSRVQHLAGLRQRSAHWIMREAIAQYVDREEAREGFKQEALASWAEYQETGRHLTGKEARAWLSTWGTETATKLPKYHK